MRRKKETRTRLTSASGQEFTFVDRGVRGFQVDLKFPSEPRIRHRLDAADREPAIVEARDFVEELLRARASKGAPTLTAIASELIVHKTNVEKKAVSYVAKIEGHLVNYVLPFLGPDTLVPMVTSADLRALKKWLADPDTEIDPKTANRILTSTRQLLKYGEDAGYSDAPALPRNFPEKLWQARERWVVLAPAEVVAVIAKAPPEVVAL